AMLLGGGGPPAAVVRVGGLEVVRRGGRAVGHDHEAGGHDGLDVWTSSTSRSSTDGSVSGRTPWPRLKMWPGRPPLAARTARASAANPGQRAGHPAGARLPSAARPGQ